MPPTLSPHIVPLKAAVQNYAWGLPASADCIVSRMHAQNASASVDARLPYAELWIGTHKSAPALVKPADDAQTLPLSDFLATDGASPTIPYLLKILSVAKPLSIQAHPDRALAGVLHARNPAAYRDDNHKPEMAVALTDFEGLCSFLPAADIAKNLEALPPLAALCGGKLVVAALAVAEKGKMRQEAMRVMFSSLMSANGDAVTEALEEVVEAIKLKDEASSTDELFIRLTGYYPGDVGCFAAYLLNHVRIKPGQAFFMAANEPHAYLKGQCVEIMACSDNVVRAGLTPKFKDVSTLIDMLTYQDGPPTIMEGVALDKYSRVYQPPAEEFQLTKVVVPAGETYEMSAAKGVGMIMGMDGAGSLGLVEDLEAGEQKLDRSVPLGMGNVYFVADSKPLVVRSHRSLIPGAPSPDLVFFRAGINQSSRSD